MIMLVMKIDISRSLSVKLRCIAPTHSGFICFPNWINHSSPKPCVRDLTLNAWLIYSLRLSFKILDLESSGVARDSVQNHLTIMKLLIIVHLWTNLKNNAQFDMPAAFFNFACIIWLYFDIGHWSVQEFYGSDIIKSRYKSHLEVK